MFEPLGVIAGRDKERPSDLHAYSKESHELRSSRLNEGFELVVEQSDFAV